MSDINVITLSGRLGRDVSFVVLPSGDDCAEFSIGNNTYAGSTAEGPQYKLMWMDCQWKSRRAQAMAGLLRQGQWVAVTGQLKSYRPGNDTKAPPRYFIEVSDVTLPPVPKAARSDGVQPREQPRGNAPPPSRPPSSDDGGTFQY